MHRDKPGAPGWTDTERLEHTGKDGGSGQINAADKILEMAAQAEANQARRSPSDTPNRT
jgi:hypothetical protein